MWGDQREDFHLLHLVPWAAKRLLTHELTVRSVEMWLLFDLLRLLPCKTIRHIFPSLQRDGETQGNENDKGLPGLRIRENKIWLVLAVKQHETTPNLMKNTLRRTVLCECVLVPLVKINSGVGFLGDYCADEPAVNEMCDIQICKKGQQPFSFHIHQLMMPPLNISASLLD